MSLRPALAGLALAAATIVTPLAAAPAHAAFTSCGEFSFGSSQPVATTNYGVKNLRAEGIACGGAKTVAKGVLRQHGNKFKKNGFTCRGGAIHDHVQGWSCRRQVKHGHVVVLSRIRFTSVGAT